MTTNNVLIVIPARKGSKGLPGKNTMLLHGHPLISYVIKAAQQCCMTHKLIVSTNDERVVEIARSYGVEVPFLRPDELAQDDTPIVPVLKHAMLHFDALGWKANFIVSLQPTNPLTTAETIDSVIRTHITTDCDSVATVSQMKNHPYRAKVMDQESRLTNFLKDVDGERYLYRQQMPRVISYNGAIYSRKRELIEKWTGEYLGLGHDIRGVVVEDHEAVDINNLTDFKFANLLLLEKNHAK